MPVSPRIAEATTEPASRPPLDTPPLERGGIRLSADALAAIALAAMTGLVIWHRFNFDNWLSRHDLLAFFLPWYGLLGERLRDFDVPGWNPYVFSGTPLAADPESGWMYLPAMVAFTLFSITTAMKFYILIQLAIAAASTYIFSRVLGYGAMAALATAMFYEFGPFLYVQTSCCTVGGQIGTWIPLALLAVELSLRARRWRTRLGAWALGGLAISQFFSGWPGQGMVSALVLTGGWVLYRSLLSSPVPRSFRDRLVSMVTTGPAVLLTGAGIAAAGIWPRLAFVAESINPGGEYERLSGGQNESPWRPFDLFRFVVADRYSTQSVALGGAVLVLMVLAPFLARRQLAVPFFLVTAIVTYALTLERGWVHDVLYLLPGFQSIHEHSPTRILWVGMLAPAMLAGASIDRLSRVRGRWFLLPLVLIPGGLVLWGMNWLDSEDVWIGWPVLIAVGITTATLSLVVVLPRSWGIFRSVPVTQVATVVILITGFTFPTAKDITDSFRKEGGEPEMIAMWQRDPATQRAIQLSLDDSDPGGAGDFLKGLQESEQPFRFVGYGGRGMAGGDPRSYPDRRLEDQTIALLQNARPMVMGLPQIQGYNPLQLENYSTLIAYMNGRVQNYHYLDLLESGVRSPILDMLAVRYVVLDAHIPLSRYDAAGLIQDSTLVFSNPNVLVFENRDAFAPAWIVHDVRAMPTEQGLGMIAGGSLNARQTAFVEQLPDVPLAPAVTGADSAKVTRYEPEHITIQASAGSDGFMVLSEIYDPGWKATVDGKSVEVVETNGALRGIPLPAGDHTVEFRYDPKELRYGLYTTTIFSLAALAAFVLAGWTLIGDRRAARLAGRDNALPVEDVPVPGSDKTRATTHARGDIPPVQAP